MASSFAILCAWAQAHLSVVGTPEILWEYERVLIELIQPRNQVKLCRDPDDDMFLICAVAAHAGTKETEGRG